VIAAWLAIAWIAKAISLRRQRERPGDSEVTPRE